MPQYGIVERAEFVFGTGDDYVMEDESVTSLGEEHYTQPDEPVQLEFNFKNVDELEGELRQLKKRYAQALYTMSDAALSWKRLMDAVESNPYYRRKWDELCLLMKLGGDDE